MFKVILVIVLLIGLAFVVQGFAEVASAPDLFGNPDDVEDSEVSNE